MGKDHKPLRWSPEEDAKLIRFIKEHAVGTWDWASLPEKAGLARSAKSCNSRWNDYLRDDFKVGNFTKEEEETIVRLHQALGNRLATIAKYLPGRSTLEIKNHWKHNLMKRVRWIKKPDGTSEALILPYSFNDDKKKKSSRSKESSTSISCSSAGGEFARSITRFDQSDLEQVYMVNNSLSENGNPTYRGNSSCTVANELEWSPIRLCSGATDNFSSIFADNSNTNPGRDGRGSLGCVNSWAIGPGEEFAWPTGSIYFGHEERAVVNNILDESNNPSKEAHDRTSMDVAVRETEQNSELVELFLEPVCSDVPQSELIINTPTWIAQGSDEVYDASLVVSTPGLLYGDLGWNDSHFLYGSCGNLNEEGYFRGSMEVAVEETVWYPDKADLYPDQMRSDMSQGGMAVKMPAENKEASK